MSNLPASESPQESSPELTLAGLPADLFWEKYHQKILGGLAVVVVIAIAASAWLLYAYNERVSSESLFANAKTSEDYRMVADQYPRTPVAANALLLLAANQRTSSDLTASSATYEELLASSPNEALAPSASLGLATNAELAKQAPRAIELLQQTTAAYQNSYAAPYALYECGEIQLREGKRTEAIKTFRDLAGSYPESASASLAQMQIQQFSTLAD